ncbi:hypothetical protein ACA910_009982 [Epithemia clementina (nom. ined.)]
MDVVIGFGIKIAANALRSVASFINPCVEPSSRGNKQNEVPLSTPPVATIVTKEVISLVDDDNASVHGSIEDKQEIDLKIIATSVSIKPELSIKKWKGDKSSPLLDMSVIAKKKRGTKPCCVPASSPEEYIIELPFVFEEMDKVWTELSSSCQSKLMGCGHFDRQHMRYATLIHAVYQSMYKSQLTVICNLFVVPHGQNIKGTKQLPLTGVTTKENFPLFEDFPSSLSGFGFVETCQVV